MKKDIEWVQRLASKIYAKDLSSPYEDHLSLLKLSTPSLRRTALKLCFLYKIVNGLVFAPLNLQLLCYSFS